MHKFIKVVCLAGLVSLLSACEDQNSYEYLVTHPVALKKKMDDCTSIGVTAAGVERQQCEVAASASNKFMEMLNQQQIDPEKFGTRIMMAEAEYADAKTKVKQLQTDVDKAKATNDAAVMSKLNSELTTAKKECEDKRLVVKVMLAVVGLSAPN